MSHITAKFDTETKTDFSLNRLHDFDFIKLVPYKLIFLVWNY